MKPFTLGVPQDPLRQATCGLLNTVAPSTPLRSKRKTNNPRYETLYTGGSPGPPETRDVRVVDDGGPYDDADMAD